jgi:hypothetical protein
MGALIQYHAKNFCDLLHLGRLCRGNLFIWGPM